MTIKNWVLEKTSEFEKKTLSFEKHLGFWKNLRFEKKNLSLKKDMRFEKKPWVLKKSEFLKNLSFYKEKIIGLKIRPQT